MQLAHQIINRIYTGKSREVSGGWDTDEVVWPTQPQPGAIWRGYRIGFDAPPPSPDRSAEIEAARLEALYQAAMQQQSASCDANFYGLLTAIGALARGTGQTVPAKAAACIAWLESLWADYHARKASGSTNYDFSGYGRCPHSFLEVRGD